MAALDMQPKLTESEGSGCPRPQLGLNFPCREGATSQLLGSAYQECEKVQCPMLHSPVCLA